ncbi:hypothetical protein MUK42_10511, partial [Musa troglodytarum]
SFLVQRDWGKTFRISRIKTCWTGPSPVQGIVRPVNWLGQLLLSGEVPKRPRRVAYEPYNPRSAILPPLPPCAKAVDGAPPPSDVASLSRRCRASSFFYLLVVAAPSRASPTASTPLPPSPPPCIPLSPFLSLSRPQPSNPGIAPPPPSSVLLPTSFGFVPLSLSVSCQEISPPSVRRTFCRKVLGFGLLHKYID